MPQSDRVNNHRGAASPFDCGPYSICTSSEGSLRLLAAHYQRSIGSPAICIKTLSSPAFGHHPLTYYCFPQFRPRLLQLLLLGPHCIQFDRNGHSLSLR